MSFWARQTDRYRLGNTNNNMMIYGLLQVSRLASSNNAHSEVTHTVHHAQTQNTKYPKQHLLRRWSYVTHRGCVQKLERCRRGRKFRQDTIMRRWDGGFPTSVCRTDAPPRRSTASRQPRTRLRVGLKIFLHEVTVFPAPGSAVNSLLLLVLIPRPMVPQLKQASVGFGRC
jgi:hypothetical protein